MRGTETTWKWTHREGRDTCHMDADRVGTRLRNEYRDLWDACQGRVRAGEAVAAPPAAPTAQADDAATR